MKEGKTSELLCYATMCNNVTGRVKLDKDEFEHKNERSE